MVETVYEDSRVTGGGEGKRLVEDVHHPTLAAPLIAEIPEVHRRTGQVEDPSDPFDAWDKSNQKRPLVACTTCRMRMLQKAPLFRHSGRFHH